MEMSFNGDFEVGIPRGEAFTLLSDPEKFLPVLPMYHSMAKKENEPDTSVVKLKIGIGKVHGIATTEMSLQDRDEPTSASYVGKGNVMGGAYNRASWKPKAAVRLSPSRGRRPEVCTRSRVLPSLTTSPSASSTLVTCSSLTKVPLLDLESLSRQLTPSH